MVVSTRAGGTISRSDCEIPGRPLDSLGVRRPSYFNASASAPVDDGGELAAPPLCKPLCIARRDAVVVRPAILRHGFARRSPIVALSEDFPDVAQRRRCPGLHQLVHVGGAKRIVLWLHVRLPKQSAKRSGQESVRRDQAGLQRLLLLLIEPSL